MNKFIASLLLMTSTLFAGAQISITKADMPVPNDTFRLSRANSSAYDFSLSGANYNWDFSQLTAAGQKMESYVAISATPPVYNLVFMYPYIATIARERPDAQLATISITNGYDFFKATNSAFKQVGFGAEVNGAPVPVQYQSADVIYPLPMSYGNVDSSDAYWQLSIPSLGFISQKIHRVNSVDGWGQLQSPYGSFSCLRLKSEVTQVDSFHYDSLPLPFPPITSHYTEYLWLTNGIGFPLVKATERNGLYQVEYIDSIKSFTGIPSPQARQLIVLYPNPASEKLHITVPQDLRSLRIFNINGKLMYQGPAVRQLSVEGWTKGVYFVRFELKQKVIYKRLIIN